VEQGGDAECQPGRQRQARSLGCAGLIETDPACKGGQQAALSLLWVLDDQPSSCMQ
jgi:hypothetical protein